MQAVFEERVTIVYYYPNMNPDLIDALVEKGYKGIVIAGTGLGHVNRKIYPALDRARSAGVLIFMAVQTLWGFVQMYVYETGREILELGVTPLANMLPEVAYIKLGWALGVHPERPRGGAAAHGHADRGRDHRARAARRLPGAPGRRSRDPGVPGQGLEVNRRGWMTA